MRRPSNGLRVLLSVSVLLLFALAGSQVGEATNPTSVLLASTPTPTPRRGTPPKATPAPRTKPTPTTQPQRVRTNPQGARLPSSPNGSWIQIASEGFEGIFPSTGWTLVDLSNDGYERYWKDASYWDGAAYRANSGFWAAWPASGGADGYSPSTNNNYSNNMDTRMIYGPFNLSDAVDAEVYFFLWREIEPFYDYLAFEISLDGVNFQELARWDGFVQNWEFESISLRNYTGYSSPVGYSNVWVAWRFYSDYSVTYQGPWVDDISLFKLVPGQVTAQGWVNYYDRANALVPARFASVKLFDQNTSGTDFELATANTDQDGFFQFPTLRNWDYWDSGDPDHTLDLYIRVQAVYYDNWPTFHKVTYISGGTYDWRRQTTNMNVPDGIVDLSYDIPLNDTNRPAMWIFQDLRRAWQYVNGQTSTDPGSVTATWQDGFDCYPFQPSPVCGSLFYGGIIGSPFIFIAHRDVNSADTVVHETGHHYMFNATNWWWWNSACWGHHMFDSIDANCAWSEGWGDFFALPVNSTLNPNASDTCYDFDIGPCTGQPDIRHYNLETHSRNDNPQQFPWGDAVEGRVAGALYDLYDNTNDGYDQASFGFSPVWSIIRTAPTEISFSKFWDSWKATGNEKHFAVQAIYQNTIDYDTAPIIANVPDIQVLRNTTFNHAIGLWTYSYDPESTNVQLTYQITAFTDLRCGVTLDTYFVNITPQRDWTGSCDITVAASDGIKTGSDTFTVNVVPVGRIYLPFIAK